MKPSECHAFTRQAWAGLGSHLHKASFIKRRLFYLNHHRQCEGVLVLARSNLPYCSGDCFVGERSLLAMTIYKGMQ